MTRKENHDASMSKKRFTTCDYDGLEPWSDLNHDVLLIVMMQLGFVDFLAFGGVCKSWRSLALSYKNKFMASRPQMYIFMPIVGNEKDDYCYLREADGRKFKRLLPHSGGRNFIGITCDYMVLYGRKTRDFWLVNPITRHELYFPEIMYQDFSGGRGGMACLVFSPLMSRWVFVLTDKFTDIWVSIVGEGTWTYVYSDFDIVALNAFKGNIYTINDRGHLCELTIHPEPKLKLLNKIPDSVSVPQLVSSSENLYVMTKGLDGVHKLDFDKLNWVPCENIGESCAFFRDHLQYVATVELECHGSDHYYCEDGRLIRQTYATLSS